MEINSKLDVSTDNENKRKYSEIEKDESNTNGNSKKSKVNNNNNNNTENCNKKTTGVSELYKYCWQHKLVLPCYKIYETTDYQNKKLFYVQCNIKNVVETGVGKKKKEGKHKAANLLLDKLKNKALGSAQSEHDIDVSVERTEDGEICDLEEGEISDTVDRDSGNSITTEDALPIAVTKYKSCKVYMEGNVCKMNMISSDNKSLMKSDVDKLADFCFEQQLPSARYEFNEHCGFNVPIFTCKCNVLQLTIKASGPSRSAVKEKASRMLLEKMMKFVDLLKPDDKDVKNNKYRVFDLEEGEILDDEDESNVTSKPNNKRCKAQNQSDNKRFKNSFAQSIRNPQNELGIRDLYNYCMKLNIPPPTYVMLEKEDVSPSKTIFTFRCTVLRVSKEAKGTNKRSAQERAARLVLKKLQNWNKEKAVDDVIDESELEDGELTAKDEIMKNNYIEHKLMNNFVSYQERDQLHLQSITQQHNSIKVDSKYKCSTILTYLKDREDVVLRQYGLIILEGLCKELDCTYDLYNLKSSQNCLAAITLNTKPSWSMFGEGNNKKEAESDSIYRLLQFLKTMNE